MPLQHVGQGPPLTVEAMSRPPPEPRRNRPLPHHFDSRESRSSQGTTHCRWIHAPPIGVVCVEVVSRIKCRRWAARQHEVDLGLDNSEIIANRVDALKGLDWILQMIEDAQEKYDVKRAHGLRPEVKDVDRLIFHS